MKRKASAVWNGSLKEGKGSISSDSGVLSKTQYSFGTRFENGQGTNPEELIAAAHAGCFSMALSAQLGNEGVTPEAIETTATVTLEKLESGFEVTEVHLEVVGKVPGGNEAIWKKCTENAKTGCPISKLLNAKITMNARLEATTSVKSFNQRSAQNAGVNAPAFLLITSPGFVRDACPPGQSPQTIELTVSLRRGRRC